MVDRGSVGLSVIVNSFGGMDDGDGEVVDDGDGYGYGPTVLTDIVHEGDGGVSLVLFDSDIILDRIKLN